MAIWHTKSHRWCIGRDEIGHDQDPYMRKWFAWCPWFGIRVHNILRSDPDVHLHDHPWDFVSILLTGGYTEVLPVGGGSVAFRLWPRWSVVRRKAEDLHCLLVSRPLWTLVLTGPKRKSWGFQTGQGMIPWRKYLGIS